ncbi:MAG: hypothetical protein ABIN08_19355 [Caldimonas sp.]
MSAWLLAACGLWLIGLGLYFALLRPTLLPEDLRFMGTTLPEIQAAAPGMASWLSIVFTVMGGFMAGAGALTTFIGLRLVQLRIKGTAWAIALSGLLTVVLMSGANFMLSSDFRWLLLLPALLWVSAFLLYAVKR